MGIVVPRSDLPTLSVEVARRQRAGERAVFTNGVFDLLHLGHLQYLQRARTLGDLLIVGVNSDASTRALKGWRRPLVPESERAEMLASLMMIDYITIFDEPTAGPLIEALRPAVYVKGADYAVGSAAQANEQARDYLLAPAQLQRALGLVVTAPEDAPAARYWEPTDTAALATLGDLGARLPEARNVAAYGGALALLAYLPGHSTSELIARIVERYSGQLMAGD